MPLTFADTGKKHWIHKINGSRELRKHLADLGFVTGSCVTVVSEIGGNLIVNVKDSRVAISREMANQIIIKEPV